MTRPISVHVWSDIACPWCFIGKRRFEKGVAAFGGKVALEYHSFELAPDTPVDFEGSAVDFLSRHKHLSTDQVTQMLEHVAQLARTEGLAYDFASVKHTRTLLAHEALHHAKTHGLQIEFVERLFAAYFEQGRHIGHVEELVALAAEVGLDADDLRRALADGIYAGAVEQDSATARAYGISGVPFYVIDGRYGVSGAQSPETFAETLREVARERTAHDADADGEAALARAQR
jgi:predicted DsbA family dithiol-disulfide isomerase